MQTKELALYEIFPLIHGNISEYTVIVPESYETQYMSYEDKNLPSDSPLFNNCLIGEKDDIANILSQAYDGNKIHFSTSRGIIRSRFTADVGLDSSGRFIDRNCGPITREIYENMGMEVFAFMEQYFHDIPGVPMLLIMGNLKGSYVRMLYLYSPVDNLTILFSLQGGMDQDENDATWIQFVQSF